MMPMNKEINLKNKIEKHLKSELISKIYYVSSLIIDVKIVNQKKIKLKFKDKVSSKTFSKIKNDTLLLINKLILKPAEPKKTYLYKNIKKKYKNYKDLRKTLINNNEIFKEGEGVYSLGNKLTKLNNFFDRELLKIANKYSAEEFSFPSLISMDKLNKVGYFDNFPHSCCFAGHLKEEYDIINDFKIDHVSNISNKLNIKSSLSPTVCHHLYFNLEDKKLSKNFIATAKSDCFRYETKNMNSLERTWNFKMREIIILGNQKYTSEMLKKIQKSIFKLLDKINLSYVVESANDPFFEGNYNDLISYQKAFKLKYEVRAYTPYNNSSIAIGSFNNSQNLFGKKLNIKLNNEFIHSSCVGFGFERFAYCFVSQHGLNINNWPETVKNSMI